MTKRELARRVAEQTGQPQAKAAQAVDALLAAIAESLAVRQRGLSGMSLGLTPVRR